MIVFAECRPLNRKALNQCSEDLAFITGRVPIWVQALINGMAHFLEEYCQDLLRARRQQPAAVEVDLFALIACGGGVAAECAAHGAAVQQLEFDAQISLDDLLLEC